LFTDNDFGCTAHHFQSRRLLVGHTGGVQEDMRKKAHGYMECRFTIEEISSIRKGRVEDDNPVLMVVKLKLRGGYSGSGEKLSINECVVKEKMYLCSLNRLILCHAKKPTS